MRLADFGLAGKFDFACQRDGAKKITSYSYK